MENAAEALKIAFAIAMFVMALTLSISSFSQANNAVNSIIAEKDRDVGMEVATMDLGYEQYVYVQPSDNLSRIVGIETVISSLYRVPEQNLEVHFLERKADGSEIPMYIYELVDGDGKGLDRYTNYIDLAHPNLNFDSPTEFLDILIGGNSAQYDDTVKKKYYSGNGLNPTVKNRFYFEDGLYQTFKDAKFEERLGEYEQGTGTAKITKRVITYVLQ